MSTLNLFGEPVPPSWNPEPNSCRLLFGPGPDGAKCRTCVHLQAHQPGNRVFWKCGLRTFTRGAKSDHRVRWKACAKYQPAAGGRP